MSEACTARKGMTDMDPVADDLRSSWRKRNSTGSESGTWRYLGWIRKGWGLLV